MRTARRICRPKLTYFDFDGSRGLECRLALNVARVEFEDDRIKRAEWLALKPTLPYGALPVLEDGDLKLAHSSPILCYVGRKHGLHPTDLVTAARHEALMNSVEDLRNKVPGRGLSDDEKKAAREAFAAGWLSQWAETVSSEVVGPFVAGDTLHVVDLKLYTILRAYLGGMYDNISLELFEKWPKLAALHAAVDAHPAVRSWLD
ncbi:MAG: glutathione S-transferase [Proteobacteria bacterium]|nr:glutathione S-transferase [Pseudomonadota bacterium]MCP4918988.1 glutathione S-transferase [Pseudomonadota bacterium]